MKWDIIVHPEAVEELDQLPADMKAKLTRLLEIIQQIGPLELREPHVKKLKNKLEKCVFLEEMGYLGLST